MKPCSDRFIHAAYIQSPMLLNAIGAIWSFTGMEHPLLQPQPTQAPIYPRSPATFPCCKAAPP